MVGGQVYPLFCIFSTLPLRPPGFGGRCYLARASRTMRPSLKTLFTLPAFPLSSLCVFPLAPRRGDDPPSPTRHAALPSFSLHALPLTLPHSVVTPPARPATRPADHPGHARPSREARVLLRPRAVGQTFRFRGAVRQHHREHGEVPPDPRRHRKNSPHGDRDRVRDARLSSAMRCSVVYGWL